MVSKCIENAIKFVAMIFNMLEEIEERHYGQDRYVSLGIMVEKKSKMLARQNTNNFLCYKTSWNVILIIRILILSLYPFVVGKINCSGLPLAHRTFDCCIPSMQH
jgi:hypothetical protein